MTQTQTVPPTDHAALYDRWQGLWGVQRRPWQLESLDLLARTKGVAGLFLDPGLGKTACVFDYLHMLATAAPERLPVAPRDPDQPTTQTYRVNGGKGAQASQPTRLTGWDGAREVRVLVVAPPTACDTWVRQPVQWLPPWVGVWAEVLGGSGVQRALTIGTRALPWSPPSTQDPARFAGSPARERQIRKGLSAWWGKDQTWTPGLALADQVLARPAEPYVGQDPDLYSPLVWGPDKGKALADQRDGFPDEWRAALCSAGPSAVSNPWAVDTAQGRERADQPLPRVTLLVVPMPTLSNTTRADWLRGVWNQAVQSFAPEVLVVDESHMVKGWDTSVSMATEFIARRTPRRVLLSGTPMPRSILDIGGQWRILAPYDFRDAGPGPAAVFTRDKRTQAGTLDQRRFEERYALESFGGRPQPNPATLPELATLVQSRSIRRTKDELPADALPPITHNRVYVQLSPNEQLVYDAMTDRRRKAKAEGDENQIKAAGIAMRMAVCGLVSEQPVIDGKPVPTRHTVPSERLTVGTTKADAACELATTTLAGERRLVIFGEFRGDLDQIVTALEASNKNLSGGLPVEVLRIDGSVPYDERIAIRQRFGKAPTDDETTRLVLVAQISTMSTSVNELVTAQHAIWTGITWNRVDWVQSADRLHRQGQKGSVTCWQILADHSIDDEVLTAHEQKRSVEDAVTNAT